MKLKFRTFLRFLLSGLPSFLIAIPLNIFLVELLHLHKVLAYSLLLVLQITLNFFMLRRFTFRTAPGPSMLRKFSHFMIGIIIFRILDAALYAFLVQRLGLYYLLAQILNVGLFSIAKFLFSQYVFEGTQR